MNHPMPHPEAGQDGPGARATFLKILRDKRQAVDRLNSRLYRRGNFLTLLTVIASALATVLTAAPAIGGARLTQALGSIGPDSPSWRILCGLAAICSGLAAIATNLHRHYDISARLAKTEASAARLEALDVQVDLGACPVPDALGQYQKILADTPHL